MWIETFRRAALISVDPLKTRPICKLMHGGTLSAATHGHSSALAVCYWREHSPYKQELSPVPRSCSRVLLPRVERLPLARTCLPEPLGHSMRGRAGFRLFCDVNVAFGIQRDKHRTWAQQTLSHRLASRTCHNWHWTVDYISKRTLTGPLTSAYQVRSRRIYTVSEAPA